MAAPLDQRSCQELLDPLLQLETDLATFLDIQWRLIALSDLFATRFPEVGQALDKAARELNIAIRHFQKEMWFLMMALRKR